MRRVEPGLQRLRISDGADNVGPAAGSRLVVDVCKTGVNGRPLCIVRMPLVCQPPRMKLLKPP